VKLLPIKSADFGWGGVFTEGCSLAANATNGSNERIKARDKSEAMAL
jgi:hypothetical protein